MLSTWRLRLILACALTTALLVGAVDARLAAQGAIGTILGTVTDASGAAIPDATVRVTNTGTTAVQTTMSDSQGRYRVPDLPAGNYTVRTEKEGFQAVEHPGITLDVGANVVVDSSLPVGQVTQSVTVQGDVTQVETTSAAISNTVDQGQMRDLPLNGRNFEELIQLAPGAVVVTGAGALKNSFTGNNNYWSISGSRANGQGELLDGTNIQNYQDRGSGSGILGSTLGVDAISEFQVLTNTYGAQYGGNGSVVSAVTRSGTNDLHGSAYEFLRNDVFDARNFSDKSKLAFRKNQFGGTLGGPIKKDKMFFFGNFEGIRQDLGISQSATVPDSNVLQGFLPATGAPAACNGSGAPAGYVNCGTGSNNDTVQATGPNAGVNPFAVIQPYLNLYKTVTSGLLPPATGTGTSTVTEPAQEPGAENYALGRFDWTLSTNDSLFARYLFDSATLTEPFYGAFPQYPNFDKTRNQYLTIGEKHILSTNIINSLNLGFTRSFLDIHSQALDAQAAPGVLPAGSLDWSGNIFTPKGEPIMDGTLSPGSSISAIGPGQIAPIRYGQNKIAVGDDLFWNKGSHSLRFGGSVTRIQTNGLHPFPGGGTWTFATLANFMTDIPQQFSGACNGATEAGCVFPNTTTALPAPSSQHDMRETQTTMYVQDDWKARPSLTVNVGLRYAPTNNPWDAFNQIYMLLPVPYGQGQAGNIPPAVGALAPTTLTPEHNFMLKNPSLHNIDPRIGIAWDPFKDHKTSVRAGYGIFHAVTQARDYSYGAFFAQPWTQELQTIAAAGPTYFPNPFAVPATGLVSMTWGTNPYNSTPYLQQWNVSVQREVMKNTVVSVAYVGSHGVHLVGQADMNPAVAVGALTADNTGSVSVAAGQTIYPSFNGEFANLVPTQSLSKGVLVPAAPLSAVVLNANGSLTCTQACTLATGNTVTGAVSGTPVVDPATGQMVYSHITFNPSSPAASAYSIQPNAHINPNFSYMQAGSTDDYSHYNALQAGFVRRMTNNFSFQASYTYSDCVDISSGNWSQEGGTANMNAYNVFGDRGPCTFMIRHNLSTNGLYLVPFTQNRLVSGWQIGGIFYYATGGPFQPTMFSADSLDSDASNRPNYAGNNVTANGSCNNSPIEATPIPAKSGSPGVYYVNPNCFVAPPVGESGNVGRDEFFGPNSITLNTSVQKNTKISERFNLQFRWEVFNILNRKNFASPGLTPAMIQGAGSSAASVGSSTTTTSVPGTGTFGEITSTNGYPLNGSSRQMQFGLKLIF